MRHLTSSGELARRLRIVTISLGAWTGVAGLFLLQRLFAAAFKGVETRHLALDLSVTWGSWAVLTPLIFIIVRKLPLPSEHPTRMLLHIPIGVGVGTLHSLLVAVITPLFLWRPSLLPIRDMFAGRLASAIAFETLIYFLVVAVVYAGVYASQAGQGSVRPALVESLESLAVPERDGLVKVPVGAIDWIQAEDNYVRLHAGGRSHLLRTTLSALEKRLASRDFIRIHRSAMVSVSRIARLRRLSSDSYAVVLTTGAQLRVSRAYRKQVMAAVGTPVTPE